MSKVTELKKAGILEKSVELTKEQKAAIESLSATELKALQSMAKKLDPSASTVESLVGSVIIVHHH